MATLRLFARAREVAGRSVDTVTPDDKTPDTVTPHGETLQGTTPQGTTQHGAPQSGASGDDPGTRTSLEGTLPQRTLTVDDVISIAVARYGSDFAALLPTCRIWVNGEPVPGSTLVGDSDEVAVLPPVSGG